MARISWGLLHRLGGMLIVLALVVTVVFIIVRVTPGDPAAVMLGSDATPEDIAQLRSRMGLDAPLIVQYGQFVGGILNNRIGRYKISGADPNWTSPDSYWGGKR